ncbi:MAG: hypothetical protein K2Q14_02200, partial [Gammaproteobacteria bacterium]|nr:hypothetical protein [Gammaproteobacteria bacterium]
MAWPHIILICVFIYPLKLPRYVLPSWHFITQQDVLTIINGRYLCDEKREKTTFRYHQHRNIIKCIAVVGLAQGYHLNRFL